MGQNPSKDSNNNLTMMASQLSLKKMIPQLLLSVSIFSFVFSSYSSFTSSSILYLPPKFYSNKFQLILGRTAFNKNCLFLICNGLLVLLATTSGFNIDYPAGFDHLNDMLQKKICCDNISMETLQEIEDQETLVEKYAKSMEETKEPLEQEEELEDLAENNEEKDHWSNDIEESKEVSIYISDDVEKDKITEDDHHEPRSFWLFDGDEDQLLYHEQEEEEKAEEREVQHRDDHEEDEKEDKRDLSTEELNKKVEEFIRKMKKEIIVSETQQKMASI